MKISEEDAKSIRRQAEMRKQIYKGMIDVWRKHFWYMEEYDDVNDPDEDPLFKDLEDMIDDVFCQNAVLEQDRRSKCRSDDAPWRKDSGHRTH